jgi:hypothetical protein
MACIVHMLCACMLLFVRVCSSCGAASAGVQHSIMVSAARHVDCRGEFFLATCQPSTTMPKFFLRR